MQENVKDVEIIEEMEDSYEYFLTELMANLFRLAAMNKISDQFMSSTQTEAVLNIQTKMNELNQNLTSFRELVSAHEVERFYREVNNTLDWMAEETKSLERDIKLGTQFRSVYVLKDEFNARRERLLAAKGHRVVLLFLLLSFSVAYHLKSFIVLDSSIG